VQLSKQPEYYLDDAVVGTSLTGQYQKALAAIRTGKEDIAIKILSKHVEKHTHPWIRLALAEAYTSDNNNKKALETLSALAKLYPGYLPVTMAYVGALNSNNEPDKSITLLKKQLQTDDYAIIYKALANAYFANGQISAALESTGNQYARQGYIELAIQQYDNALRQDDISPSTRKRLETQKQELKKIMQRYKEQL
jgi:predicted Zn-dependent protease